MKISGRNIEAALARKGWTKTKLAQESNLNTPNICMAIRRGSCLPVTAGKIAAALGVDVTEIMESA